MIRFQKFAQEKYTKSRTYQDSALQYQGKKAHTIQGWDESPRDFKYQKNIMMPSNKSKFTSSVGAVTLDAVKKYIEKQKK